MKAAVEIRVSLHEGGNKYFKMLEKEMKDLSHFLHLQIANLRSF